MATTERTLGALGLCARARGLICGTPMVCEALAGRKKPRLVLAAADNSSATDKRLADRCAYYGVRLEKLTVTGAALAHAVGKHAHLAAVAVTDENLCRLVLGTMEENHNV